MCFYYIQTDRQTVTTANTLAIANVARVIKVKSTDMFRITRYSNLQFVKIMQVGTFVFNITAIECSALAWFPKRGSKLVDFIATWCLYYAIALHLQDWTLAQWIVRKAQNYLHTYKYWNNFLDNEQILTSCFLWCATSELFCKRGMHD